MKRTILLNVTMTTLLLAGAGAQAAVAPTAGPAAAKIVNDFFSSPTPNIKTLYPVLADIDASGGVIAAPSPLSESLSSAIQQVLKSPQPASEAESIAQAEKLAALMHPVLFNCFAHDAG